MAEVQHHDLHLFTIDQCRIIQFVMFYFTKNCPISSSPGFHLEQDYCVHGCVKEELDQELPAMNRFN
jgi:hypothetical protein